MREKHTRIFVMCIILILVFVMGACNSEVTRNPTITPFPLITNTPIYQPLIDALTPVLQERGVPEAAAFNPVVGGTYPLVIIMDRDGEPYDKWNENIPPEWVPFSLSEVELVVYVHEYESGRYCGSASYSDGSTITGVCVDTVVKIRDAQSGKLIKQWVFNSAPPHFAERTVESSRRELRSIPIGFADFWEWLIGDEGLNCMPPSCLPVGQSEWLDDLAFSLDGQILATGITGKEHFSGNTIRLWRVSDGELLSTLGGPLGGPNSENIIFSPDGLTLASGYSGSVKIYQVEDGQQLSWLKGHGAMVQSLAFSLDGQILASGSGGMETDNLRLWQVSDGEQLHALVGHEDSVECLAFSPDGLTLASGGGTSASNMVDNNVRLWRVSDGELLHTLKGHTEGVESVAFSPDGQILASGGHDIRLWRVEDGELLHTLDDLPNWLITFTFSSDGQSLLAIDFDGTIHQWRVDDGATLKTIEGFLGHPVYKGYKVIFSPDGQTLASSDRKTLRFYSIQELLAD